jgi:hypothetical protein
MSNVTESLHATPHWLPSPIRITPILQLQLPNLRVLNVFFSLRTSQNDLLIHADIVNDGNAKSGPCKVQLQTSINNQPPVTQPLIDCPALVPFETWGTDFTLHNVPFNAWVIVIVTVDPPSPGHPGGSVWESNETDNTLMTQHFVDV